jgi:hypothetical protein
MCQTAGSGRKGKYCIASITRMTRVIARYSLAAYGIGRELPPWPVMAGRYLAGGEIVAREIGQHFRIMTLTTRFLLYRGALYPVAGLRVIVHENPARAGWHSYVFALTAESGGAILWAESAPFALGAWRVDRLRAFADALNRTAKEAENFD